MSNKMFVIGGNDSKSCEIFDNSSRKFTKINSEIKISKFERSYFYAYSIRNNIVVFHIDFSETSVYSYDVVEKRWVKIQCDFTKNLFYSSFVNYYT